ncbi:MAG: hypothetical protein ACFB22_10845 [Rhodothalassiaceae bacterium]
MSRYDILTAAIDTADKDSDRILTLFGRGQGNRELPRYTTASRRRARVRRYG